MQLHGGCTEVTSNNIEEYYETHDGKFNDSRWCSKVMQGKVKKRKAVGACSMMALLATREVRPIGIAVSDIGDCKIFQKSTLAP